MGVVNLKRFPFLHNPLDSIDKGLQDWFSRVPMHVKLHVKLCSRAACA